VIILPLSFTLNPLGRPLSSFTSPETRPRLAWKASTSFTVFYGSTSFSLPMAPFSFFLQLQSSAFFRLSRFPFYPCTHRAPILSDLFFPNGGKRSDPQIATEKSPLSLDAVWNPVGRSRNVSLELTGSFPTAVASLHSGQQPAQLVHAFKDFHGIGFQVFLHAPEIRQLLPFSSYI